MKTSLHGLNSSREGEKRPLVKLKTIITQALQIVIQRENGKTKKQATKNRRTAVPSGTIPGDLMCVI